MSKKGWIFRLVNKYGCKQLLWISIYILFLIQTLRVSIVLAIPKTYDDYDNFYSLADYYINYQGGFVRRGLFGEILYFFAKHFSIHTEWATIILSLICFSFLYFFFIKSFCNKGYALYILPLCCFLWYFRSNTKDYLMISAFILNILVYRSHWSTMAKFFLINILSVFVILTHEVFGIISLPVLFLLLLGNNTMRERKDIIKSVVFSFLFLLPSILAMLLVTYAHGNQEIAQSIWDSWRLILHIQEPIQVTTMSAIGAIGWTKAFAFQFHTEINFLTVSHGIPSWLGWPVIFTLIYYMLINYLSFFGKDKENYTDEHRTQLSLILIFQFVCLLPLFAGLSCDYNRLCFYWTTSSFALFLLIPQKIIQRLSPVYLIKCVNRINNGLSIVLPPSKTLLVFLMLFIGMSVYRFFLETILNTSVVYNAYELLRDSILFLHEYIF